MFDSAMIYLSQFINGEDNKLIYGYLLTKQISHDYRNVGFFCPIPKKYRYQFDFNNISTIIWNKINTTYSNTPNILRIVEYLNTLVSVYKPKLMK